jgi:hypothetical protein
MGQHHDRCIFASPTAIHNLGWAPTRSTVGVASVIGLETYSTSTSHQYENMLLACWNLLRTFHWHARDCRVMIGWRQLRTCGVVSIMEENTGGTMLFSSLSLNYTHSLPFLRWRSFLSLMNPLIYGILCPLAAGERAL